MPTYLQSIKTILLALILAFGISYVSAAWSGPTQAPPNGNVDAPINVGIVDQIKNAGLGLNTLAVFGQGSFDGEVIVGSTGAACGADIEGAVRYDAGTQCLQVCTTEWEDVTCGGAVADFFTEYYIQISPPYTNQQEDRVESITLLSGGYDPGSGGSTFATTDAQLHSFVWDYWRIRQILPDGLYLLSTNSPEWTSLHPQFYARGNSTTASFLITMKSGTEFIPKTFRVMPITNWNGSSGFWGGITSFKFYGGSSSSGPWTLLTEWNVGEAPVFDVAFPITTSITYRYFKFDILATNGGLKWGLGGFAIDD